MFYDGKPAAGVQVFLFPTAAPMVPDIPANPHGVTGPDGRFTIGTYADGDGAAEGSYQVVLFWPESTGDDEEAAPGPPARLVHGGPVEADGHRPGRRNGSAADQAAGRQGAPVGVRGWIPGRN